jgi:hypothetical protein
MGEGGWASDPLNEEGVGRLEMVAHPLIARPIGGALAKYFR